VRALEFFLEMLNAPVSMICVENPVSVASSRIRPPDQIIQPWMFGDPYQKTTCLWLKNLPKLKPTNVVEKEEDVVFESGKIMPRWYADSFNLPPEDRKKSRSRTFQGIADAMAIQWNRRFQLQFPVDVKTVIVK